MRLCCIHGRPAATVRMLGPLYTQNSKPRLQVLEYDSEMLAHSYFMLLNPAKVGSIR